MPRATNAKPQPTKSASLPTGTVTFLFTDIEGSTQRWEAHKAAMADAVARHDTLMRAAVVQHAGFVFKTVGDAFCAAFNQPEEAIAAALQAQRDLMVEDFKSVGGLSVRIAIHTGSAQERDADYFGPAVNRVARLLAIGHGGQILVSGTTTDLVQGCLPSQTSLRDLGEHQLRDLVMPEQVYQLIAPGLREAFPPLKSLAALPNNLPRQATPFVGREQELAEIKALIGKWQVVTLVGTGGVGKTRIALQVGADLLDGSNDGVWFIDLAQVPGGDYLAPAIAQALGLPPRADSDPLSDVLAYLRDKHLLIILDNCEHVIGAASRMAAAIIKSCPQVFILATSREALNLHGEQVYRMPSLPAPPSGSVLSAEDSLKYGAVALFAARASAIDARFSFDDDKAPIVADICRRLDGIALAIELAAARVTILNLKQLSQRLDERFRVLTGGDRTALPRQQTMRAAIDWSYDLLSEDERTLFCRLSIFQGGWTLEAASEVCADELLDEFKIFDVLSSLVNKSLVVVEFQQDSQRYRLLESLRQYALERLRKLGRYDLVARRHAEYFRKYGQLIAEKWNVLIEVEWLTLVDSELDNIRAALQWALTEAHDPLLGAALAENLWVYWFVCLPQEGRRWLEAARQEINPQDDPALSAALDLALSRALLNFSYQSAVAAAERALETARMLEDERLMARALFYLGEGRISQGRLDEAESLLSEALELSERCRDPYRAATARHLLGRVYMQRKQYDRAREYMMPAMRFYESRGAERNHGVGLVALATLERAVGNKQRAVDLSTDACAMARTIRDVTLEALAECSLGISLAAAERFEESKTHARKALTITHDRQVGSALVAALHLATQLAIHSQQFPAAARLIGYTDVLQTDKAPRIMFFGLDAEDLIGALRSQLDAADLQALKSEGAAWGQEQGYKAALAVCEA